MFGPDRVTAPAAIVWTAPVPMMVLAWVKAAVRLNTSVPLSVMVLLATAPAAASPICSVVPESMVVAPV